MANTFQLDDPTGNSPSWARLYRCEVLTQHWVAVTFKIMGESKIDREDRL